MNLFCLAQFVMSFGTVGNLVLAGGRMFRVQALNSLLSVCVLVVADWLLVPAGGVRGAAWADVVYKGLSTVCIAAFGAWYLARRREP